ncbi:MAG: glycosyltransferase family 4 protein [Methanosarcina sp.]
MKIAMICDYLEEGHGIHTHVHYLSKELIKKECIDELNIITVGKNQLQNHSDNTVIILDCKNKYFSKYYSVPKKIMQLVERLKPDIIHIHGTYPPYSIIPLITKDYPIVVTLHGIVSVESKFSIKNKILLSNKIYGLLEKKAINKASRLIAVSPSLSEYCLKMGADTSIVDIIPNGIAINEYEFESNNLIHPSLLYIGRLVKIKGIDILIRALPIIKVSYPNIKLFIAGTGGQFNKINSIVKKMDLTENVIFLGKVFGSEKRRLIASTDILILPSRYEAFGIVLLEAMASGKSIVASNVGGVPYIVNNGETGLLFEVGNVKELAEKVIKLLDCEKLRLEMGRAGRKRAKDFSWNNIADQTVKTYEEVL